MKCYNCGHDVNPVKRYRCVQKEVIIGNGGRERRYSAYFPRKHSTVDAIVCENRNINAWDDWANITDYRMLFYIRWKWGKDWEEVCEHPRFGIPAEIKPSEFKGLDWVLAQLDRPEVKSQLESERKQMISELKKDISDSTRQLEELEKKQIA